MTVETTALAVPSLVVGPEPLPPPVSPHRPRRSTRSFTAQDGLDVVGSLLGGLALTGIVYYNLLTTDGVFGYLVCSYVCFLALYAIAASTRYPGLLVRDRIVAVVIQSAATIVLAALGLVIGFTVWRGWAALRHTNFYAQTMSQAGPLDPLSVGGVLHAAVGTLIMITIATVITVPLGISAAVYLNEVRGGLARPLRMLVDAMSALPSIVTGLFILAFLIIPQVLEKSGLAASLALSIMMLPIIIRASEVVLRLVPNGLREASYALGTSQWRTVWHVVLPTARSSLATAVILGMARGIGETSPVLLTAGAASDLNWNPFHSAMMSLPLATFTFVKQPQPNYVARGFGSAALLLLIVIVLFLIARKLGGSSTATRRRRPLLRSRG